MQQKKMYKKEEYTIMRIWILRVIAVSTTPISHYACCFFFMQFATPTKSGNATHIWKERRPHIRILFYAIALLGTKCRYYWIQQAVAHFVPMYAVCNIFIFIIMYSRMRLSKNRLWNLIRAVLKELLTFFDFDKLVVFRGGLSN